MPYVRRQIEPVLKRAARAFPAVVLTGPRRAGKTTLLRRLFPTAGYRLLEDPDVVAAVRADPRSFLDELRPPVILDEIQNTPELLAFIRTRIDAEPHRRGRWLLTGSQDFSLMRGVTESMAGRAAILHLFPLSLTESRKVGPLRGGYPEVMARPRDARLWFQSYIQTYIERDVRQISQVRDLATFRRFLSLLASRNGQVLNRTDLAAPLGMSVPGIGQWLNILETTGQIILVPPYFENFGKRLIKSPKVYLTDSGLACHLLGIESERELGRSPFLGSIFEGFVASEIVKTQVNAGRRRELYYFRDQRGLEVDFLLPAGSGGLLLVEVKASQTIYPAAANHLRNLAGAIGQSVKGCIVVHSGTSASRVTALTKGVQAMNVTTFVQQIPKMGSE